MPRPSRPCRAAEESAEAANKAATSSAQNYEDARNSAAHSFAEAAKDAAKTTASNSAQAGVTAAQLAAAEATLAELRALQQAGGALTAPGRRHPDRTEPDARAAKPPGWPACWPTAKLAVRWSLRWMRAPPSLQRSGTRRDGAAGQRRGPGPRSRRWARPTTTAMYRPPRRWTAGGRPAPRRWSSS